VNARSAASRSLAAAGALAVLAVGCGACNKLAVEGADQAAARSVEESPTSAISAPPGFRAVLFAEGLNYPSAMDWDANGRLYVLQSNSVPIPGGEIKVVRIEGEDDNARIVDVPLTGAGAPTGKVAIGLTFHGGRFYLSHEESDGTWGVSRFDPESGETEAVLRNLPGNGDHNVNYLAFDRAGALYFGVGSATNSGVVSSHDPVNLKWLEKRPQARDLPCRDLALKPVSFTDDDALTEAKDDRATTGAYQAYRQSGATRVAAASPCTSSVYKLAPGSTTPELVAWGFRNPVGIAVGADGAVYIGAQGADVRGTRPVRDDPDAVYRLVPGAWYGWPDFGGDFTPVADDAHAVPAEHSAANAAGPVAVVDVARSGLKAPDRSWLVHATLPHAAICGMTTVPPGGPFGAFAGQILVSEMGDFRPTTDPIAPEVRAGFQIEAVDPKSGRATTFLRNRGTGPPQPASTLDLDDGMERPVDVRVGPDGLVYVLDFGVFVPTADAGRIFPKTGRVFRVEPLAAPAAAAGR